ncbi:hypothetical protein [Fibrella aquatilis]|uniref:Uncharacterized protein n=1 Tax=Fibrella aquatilis TaxID=2817059 RepID=A0A939JXX0_9BACT|nr:hypothetical protein [Fibrella aquatilis]MBO0929738.1 hypothetical protein [Fibrella aquatilis]
MQAVDNQLAQEAFDFFLNYPNNPAAQAKKMAELQRGPTNLTDFEQRLIDFTQARSTTFTPRVLPNEERSVVQYVVPKATMLWIADHFEQLHCVCLKLCFGLDANLNTHVIVSGGFYCPNGKPTIDRLDEPYRHPSASGKGQGDYFLDFNKLITPKEAQAQLGRYQETAPLSDLHGYVMDIVTFKKLLNDPAVLGGSTLIRLRFGMNNTGDHPETAISGRAQNLMLELAPAGTPIYFCSSAIKNDGDAFDCPPRQPCNAR